jgi:hypothetical protein
MTYLYNDFFYGCNLLDFLFFIFCMHLLKFLYFISIGNLLYIYIIFFDNTHGLSFHFYLHNVRDENTFHFENFEKSFFVFF